jgi:hypothetical protein
MATAPSSAVPSAAAATAVATPAVVPTFAATYAQFVRELLLTFPEYEAPLKAALATPATDAKATFLATWRAHSHDIATKHAAVFAATPEGMPLVPGAPMTAKLWSELSDATHTAIWKYLSSLLLLAAVDGETEDMSGFQEDMETMMRLLKESGDDLASEMSGIFEKLAGIAKTFGLGGEAAGGAGAAGVDLSGAAAAASKFKIPERLFKGHIAKIAEELVKEFKPEDFGIAPEMLESDDPARVFNYLQEIFTKKPEMLMGAAQKIAKKIQAKFARGEIRREEIIAEAEELMKEFSSNTAFSSLFGSLGEMLKSTEKESGNEGSARRREVQERLRRKQAEKEARRAGAGAGAATNTLVHNPAAVAAAEAAMAALLEEEEHAKHAVAAKPAAKKKK